MDVIMVSCRNKAGFSLLEMALVLVIVGLLLSLSLNLMFNLSKTNRIKRSENKLELVKDALVGFLIKNGHLPYADSNGDGEGDTYNGLVPYHDLGLTRADVSDAYGKLFHYDVTGSPTAQGSLTDTTPQNICHQLGAYMDQINTSTTRISVDGGSNWTQVPFVILASGINKQFDGENNDGDRDYETQNPDIDDIVKWETFAFLYNKLGCGKEFYRLYNRSGANIWVLGGDNYTSCTKIPNGTEAFVQKATKGYLDNACSTSPIFSFSDCELVDFGGGNRDTCVEWNGLSVRDSQCPAYSGSQNPGHGNPHGGGHGNHPGFWPGGNRWPW